MCIEKTYIDKTLSVKQIQEKHNVPQATASRIKKRGYMVKRTKPINISEEAFDYKEALRAARIIFFIKFRYMASLEFFDDLQQEAILRCFELSGECKNGNKFSFYCRVSENAMYSYLTREHIIGTWANREISFEDNVLGNGIYE